MVKIEIVERIVRVVAVVMLAVLAWVCLGGDSLLAVPTPITSFLVHLVAFFFLAAIAYVGWADHAPRMALIMIGLAVVLEVVQVMLPGRNFTILDLSGNLIGVGIAWVFFKVLLNFKRTIRA